MRYLSLFSGIEAATVAWEPLSWVCAAVCEVAPFPGKVLTHHYPRVPNLGDITQVTEADIAMLGAIDLVVFGSPCQDLSVAGKRKGLEGERSGLFHDAMRVVQWCRTWGGCRFALWENVPGAFSSNKGADFGVVVGQMAGLECAEVPPKGWGTEGAIVGPQGMVEWSVLDAQWFGVAQRRRRVFALADFGDWSNRPPILLEPESLRGDSAPRREAGQGVAGTVTPCLTSSRLQRIGDTRGQDAVVPTIVGPLTAACGPNGHGGSGLATDKGAEAGHILPVAGLHRPVLTPEPARIPPIAMCLNAGGMGRIDAETETFVVCATDEVAHTLKADGFDASEDGTGRGTPIVPVLPFDTTQITSAANRSNPKPGDPCHPLAAGAHAPAIAFHHNAQACQLPGTERDTTISDPLTCSQQAAVAYATKLHNTASNQAGKIYEEYTTALDCSSPPPALLTAMQVRRLTPVECERLQAFPDGYTAIPDGKKLAKDGPRYKALGNSMCTSVMHWIGKQIDHAMLFY